MFFLSFLVISTAQEEAVASSFGHYHALVIGNQDYKYLNKLSTPRNDAREIKRILQNKYDFKVTLLLDATREEMLRALEKLRKEMKEEDNLLIYYAGHGILDKVTDAGYWQPIDAEKYSNVNWIPFTSLVTAIKGIQAKHILVIADSCFSGALMTTRDSGADLDYGSERWLRRMRENKSRTALTSGGKKERVFDTGGGNYSIFAKSLIDVLRNNSTPLDGNGLFDRVKVKRLIADNIQSQKPEYKIIPNTYHNDGDFIFVPRGWGRDISPDNSIPETKGERRGGRSSTPVSQPSIQQPVWVNTQSKPLSVDNDANHWKILSKQGKSGLESYIALYPNGIHVSEARRRLATLPPPEPVRVLVTETRPYQNSNQLTSQDQAQAIYNWETDIIYAKNSGAIEDFLQRFPGSKYEQEARRKLAELKAQGR
ncbi:hypothetical protein KKHLCK_14125 [Candidatus Electrothrix laxa]